MCTRPGARACIRGRTEQHTRPVESEAPKGCAEIGIGRWSDHCGVGAGHAPAGAPAGARCWRCAPAVSPVAPRPWIPSGCEAGRAHAALPARLRDDGPCRSTRPEAGPDHHAGRRCCAPRLHPAPPPQPNPNPNIAASRVPKARGAPCRPPPRAAAPRGIITPGD